jgi:hypothetical protein
MTTQVSGNVDVRSICFQSDCRELEEACMARTARTAMTRISCPTESRCPYLTSHISKNLPTFHKDMTCHLSARTPTLIPDLARFYAHTAPSLIKTTMSTQIPLLFSPLCTTRSPAIDDAFRQELALTIATFAAELLRSVT